MALTYASALAQIKTHAVAAGAAVTPAILDVDIGSPLPTSSRCVRIFYGGEIEPAKMAGGRTANSRMIGEQIVLIVWISTSNLGVQETAAIESELRAFKHDLRTRVLNDSQLGGMSTDLEMALCEVDFIALPDGRRFRTLETTFTTDFEEYPIAP